MPWSASANLGPTPLSAQRSSCGSLSPSSSRCTGARKMSPATSLVAAAASPAIPRPSGGRFCCAMCGRMGALSVSCTRCLGRSRMNASTSARTMTITHQYSRIRSIESPIPFCVVAPSKLDQIGEQEPEKEAQQRNAETFDDERQSAAVGRPAGARDTGQLVEQSDELAALEVVGRARQQHSARERPVMQMPRDLSHFVIDERSPEVALDLPCEPVGGAERAGP